MLALQHLAHLHAHERVQAQVRQCAVQVDGGQVPDAQDVGHSLHEVVLGAAITLGGGLLLSQHEAAQDGVRLVQEEVQHLQAEVIR